VVEFTGVTISKCGAPIHEKHKNLNITRGTHPQCMPHTNFVYSICSCNNLVCITISRDGACIMVVGHMKRADCIHLLPVPSSVMGSLNSRVPFSDTFSAATLKVYPEFGVRPKMLTV